jgi:hypothetical protein
MLLFIQRTAATATRATAVVGMNSLQQAKVVANSGEQWQQQQEQQQQWWK